MSTIALPVFVDKICKSRAHCVPCRTNAMWRTMVSAQFQMPAAGIDVCPFGVPTPAAGSLRRNLTGGAARPASSTKAMSPAAAKPAKSRGLGDTVAKIIHALGLDRLAPKACKPCEKRRAALNKLVKYQKSVKPAAAIAPVKPT